jgi:hypothetical protein
MENEQIESAADEMKDDKKLPADSEMQQTVEPARADDGAKRNLTPAELHADGPMT